MPQQLVTVVTEANIILLCKSARDPYSQFNEWFHCLVSRLPGGFPSDLGRGMGITKVLPR